MLKVKQMNTAMKQPPLTDQDIVNGFRCNNQDIIVAAYKLIIPNVRAFVLSRGGNKAEAEQVAWRALTKFWQRCQKTDFELVEHSSGFGAYMARTYRNIWMDWHKEGEIKLKSATLAPDTTSKEQTTLREEDDDPTSNRKSNANLEQLADEFKTDEKVALNNVSTYIWQLVDSLSEKCRDFFRLYYQKELSYEEIAQEKKVSEGAIRKQKNECKEPFVKKLTNSPFFKELQENFPHLVKKIVQ